MNIKGTDYKPGASFKQDDWFSQYRRQRWNKFERENGGRRGMFYRIGVCLIILVVMLGLRETSIPLGIETREKLKEVLTTEWNYQPVFERVVQKGLQIANSDWHFFSSPVPAISRTGEIGKNASLSVPVSGKVIRGFGMVIDPIDNMERFHPGIDIAAPVGTPVSAVMAGKVIRYGDSPALGKYILIEHSPGRFTLYGQLARATVSEGQSVEAGQALGEVGTRGDIAGSGLHFEMRENNKLIDPLTRLRIN